jgi:hypothetical protein
VNVRQDGDRLVDAYLANLTKAAEPLPEARRADLIADVTSHIAEARAAGATSEDDVRRMLQRLGDPDELVLASTDGLVLVEVPTFRGREVLALALLPLGGFIAVVGWVLGAVLLWTSDRWTRTEKWLGTLVWPFGFVSVFVLVAGSRRTEFSLPDPLSLAIWTLIVVVPLIVLGLLFRNADPGRGTQGS